MIGFSGEMSHVEGWLQAVYVDRCTHVVANYSTC